jgi:transcription elongation factor GreA
MEGRIRQLEHLLEHAEILEGVEHGAVGPGTVVTIQYEGDDDTEDYLLGHPEETPPPGVGIMSLSSPLGKALVGHREGDWVEYEANGRMLKVLVVDVETA